MMPDFNDTNPIATAKWQRARGKVNSLHIALTSGFDIPPELQIGNTAAQSAEELVFDNQGNRTQ